MTDRLDPPDTSELPAALRPWAETDAGHLARAWSDPGIVRWSPPPADVPVAAGARLEAARRWILGAEDRWRRGISHDLVVVDDEGDAVGEVGLATPTPTGSGPGTRCELGLWIRSDRTRAGHGRVAVAAMAEVAATRLGIEQVWCRTHLDNGPALGLFAACRWTRLGDRGRYAIWTAPPTLLG